MGREKENERVREWEGREWKKQEREIGGKERCGGERHRGNERRRGRNRERRG